MYSFEKKLKSFFQTIEINITPSKKFKPIKMSRTSSKSSYSATTSKRFCKVCFDSGKSVEMHTSHNVRDDRGFVCCPTLKSIICTYCGIKGHGPKYCSRLEKDKKEQQRVLSSKPIKQAVITALAQQYFQPNHRQTARLRRSKL
jgi:hypothetical protein